MPDDFRGSYHKVRNMGAWCDPYIQKEFAEYIHQRECRLRREAAVKRIKKEIEISDVVAKMGHREIWIHDYVVDIFASGIAADLEKLRQVNVPCSAVISCPICCS